MITWYPLETCTTSCLGLRNLERTVSYAHPWLPRSHFNNKKHIGVMATVLDQMMAWRKIWRPRSSTLSSENCGLRSLTPTLASAHAVSRNPVRNHEFFFASQA